MALALLCPGQGAQHVGMGQALAERYPAAASVFARADEILGYPLSRLCWEGPERELTLTQNAQPAILVHTVAVHTVIAPRLRGVALAAGHSLGEFSAHVLAGTLTFEDGLAVVRLRGELMYRAGVERPGTMAAILGLEDSQVVALCRESSGADGVCVAANYNAPGQVVISGDGRAVGRAVEAAPAAGARRAILLNVSGAFHSPLMASAEQGLRERLERMPVQDPRFPVIANVSARPVHTGAEARALLIRQLTAPVRWADSVRAMLDLGASRYLELGPGNVLCGLNRRIARDLPCQSLGDDPVALEAFEA
ncbi:MAG: ACP S-malonyltransferase [Gemmatimonadetes bacterium]|nr:ACP S-malonyltransferase [Gemmatimonadota bacterium]